MDKQELLKRIEEAKRSGATKLDLSHEKITELPPEIGKLHKLTELDLDNNQLTALPPEIANLHKLTVLILYNNQLTALPPEIGNLHNLTELYLYNNQLSALSPEIGNLHNLTLLYLDNNQLSALPPEIANLHKITNLYLENNQIQSLPPSFTNFRNLKVLDLRGNPIEGLPPEITAGYNSAQKILTYIKDNIFAKDKKPLNEAKVLFVGDPAVGKTSMIKNLRGIKFDPLEKETKGIEIDDIKIAPLDVDFAGDSIRLNLWDFGGQVIQRATHQFFFTKRSIYVLVLAPRDDRKQTVVEWLKLIEAYGDGAPAIIVCNQCDDKEIKHDWVGLKNDYPFIAGVVEGFSCKTGEGKDELNRLLHDSLEKLEFIHNPLSRQWFAVKEALEKKKKKGVEFIELSEYQKLCDDCGVKEAQSQDTLLSYLHDLGTMLHYDDGGYENILSGIVLNPVWVTQAVYKVITNEALAKANGKLSKGMLSRILPPKKYPKQQRDFILDIMQKFELCIKIQDTKKNKGSDQGNEEYYLVTNVLDPNTPVDLDDWEEGLRFDIQFEDVLPESVMSRFIGRMFPSIEEENYWRTGVVLHFEGSRALVRSSSDRKTIRITVQGEPNGSRVLLENIRHEFFKIRKAFLNIGYEESVPIPETDKFIPYEDLLDYKKEGETEPRYPPAKRRINVDELLNQVDPIQRTDEVYQELLKGIVIINPVFNIDMRTINIGEIRVDIKQTLERSPEIPIELKDIFSGILKTAEETKLSLEEHTKVQKELINIMQQIQTKKPEMDVVEGNLLNIEKILLGLDIGVILLLISKLF